MDSFSGDISDISYSDEAPVLIAGSSDLALARARRGIEASGRRVGATTLIADAATRIEQQVAASAVWLEIDEDSGGAMDDLLARVSSDVAAGRYAAVVSTTAALLDPVHVPIAGSDVDLLIDAGDADRAAALALATSRKFERLRVSDVAADTSSVRLRQLSDEVNRIAATLARLSSAPPPAVIHAAAANHAGEIPPVAPESVRSVIRARRLRSRFFDEELFADPAWDMLLDLLQAELSHLRVPVSSLCIAAAVPATTALRWLKTMVDQGLFVRRADPHDGRRVFVELAPTTSEALHRYFAEVNRTMMV
ncbi:MAG: MarR family winged helix-turn-helix transcriptional regulator [Sphingomicrobium sp.]